MPSFARKVSAYFIVKDAAQAIDFYRSAFGARKSSG
jgi:PhnB protein